MASSQDRCSNHSYSIADIPSPEKPFHDHSAPEVAIPEFSNSLHQIGCTPSPMKPFGDMYVIALKKSSNPLDDNLKESLKSVGETESASITSFENALLEGGETIPRTIGASSSVSHTETSNSMGSLSVSSRTMNPLEVARNHGQWRLLRLRGPTLSLGSLLVFGGLVVNAFGSRSQGKTTAILSSVSVILMAFGINAVALSLLPSDKRCVPLSISVIGLPLLAAHMTVNSWAAKEQLDMISSDTCSFNGAPRPCWFTFVFLFGFVALALSELVAICAFLIALRKARTTEYLLLGIRKCLCWIYFVACLVATSRIPACAASGLVIEASSFASNAVASLLASWCSCQYRFMRQIQSWLMSRGQAATAAAVISELLGGQDPEYVLAEARKTFSSVRADKVTLVAMRKNHPDPSLSALAQKTSLGHIDAFVSHSWHDDPDMKWHELQKWRAEFKEVHRREPNLWIDKYCIDQRNIEKSLACLPVYLAGCRKLVVLCGKSYLKRLWCLIEIFVFIEIGGKLENLEVSLLDNGLASGICNLVRNSTRKPSIRSSGSLAAELTQFDSLNAQCANEDDTIRLQAVIEVAGSSKINNLVSDAFVRKLARKGEGPIEAK